MITIDLNKLGLRAGHRVLDIGCGSGRHAAAVSRIPGVVVIGSDIDMQKLKEARRRIDMERDFSTLRAERCEFVISDICLLPFEDESFDLVVCSEVLEHVIDYGRAVAELWRVLKRGADLVMSVPRYYPEKICWALSDSYADTSGGHVRVFRRGQLKDAVCMRGFYCWATHYAHSLHTPYWWLKCAIGPEREDVRVVDFYHRFLVWDIMKKPLLTKLLDFVLNPVLGKSLVMYFRKVENVGT